MSREQIITREVKKHDRLLYCKSNGHALCIYRKDWAWHEYDLGDNVVIKVVQPQPYHVFALTDTWSIHGKPVNWGILPIMNRLRAIDLWNQGLTIDDLVADDLKRKISKENDFRNTTEAMLLDMRSQFARSTNDINTALFSKFDKRRIEDGYRK